MNRGYDYRKYSILYVDDEPQALKYFEKAFSRDFRIRTAPSAAEAWKIIQSDGDDIGVLITDQRMPAQSGVDLLERVRTHRPSVVRILTTAYSDLNSAIEAVNAGGAFRYVTKPWELAELKGVLLRAMEFFLVKQERDRLLSEKLSVLQRLLVMDRVRGLAALAASLSCRLQNSMGALKAYVRHAPFHESQAGNHDDAMQMDLWTLARTEGENLVTAVREVLRTTAKWDHFFDGEIDIRELVFRLVQQIEPIKAEDGVSFRVELSADVLPIRADVGMLERLLRTLIDRISDMDGEDRIINIRGSAVEVQPGINGVRLQITADGPEWRNGQVASLYSAVIPKRNWLMGIDMDVLSAFFVAHHHGGTMTIHRSEPLGPGFEVTLACNPEGTEETLIDADWFDQIFASLEEQPEVKVA
jgi:two-component system probable response regulator PhcQ